MEEAADLSCKEASRLMSLQQDTALTPVDEESLREHLQVCLSCRRFDMQLGVLRMLARRYGDDGPPDADTAP